MTIRSQPESTMCFTRLVGSPVHERSHRRTGRLSSARLAMSASAARSENASKTNALLWIFMLVLILLVGRGQWSNAELNQCSQVGPTVGQGKNRIDYLVLSLFWPNTLARERRDYRKGLENYLEERNIASCNHFTIHGLWGRLSAEGIEKKPPRHCAHGQIALFDHENVYKRTIEEINSIRFIHIYWPNFNVNRRRKRVADSVFWKHQWVSDFYIRALSLIFTKIGYLEFGNSKLERLFNPSPFTRYIMAPVWLK